MTAKQYLKQAYRLNELIDSDMKELEQLKALATSISAPNLSGMPGSSTKKQEAPFINPIFKIVDLENYISAEIDRYVDLKEEIRTVINALKDNDEKALLKYRYINFCTWETICEKLNVSLRTVHRIHASALQNIKVPE